MNEQVVQFHSPQAEVEIEQSGDMVTLSVSSLHSLCWCKVTLTVTETRNLGLMLAGLAGSQN